MVKGGYRGRSDYRHDERARTGVLLINLGTPAAPTAGAVRRYLAEFLNDPRVIELPAPLRRALVHGVVLRIRPRTSARAYRRIWSAEGSPLLHYSRSLCTAVRDELLRHEPGALSVSLAMRYGEPRVADALRELADGGVTRLLVLPLYPQYSGATIGSAFDALAAELVRTRWVPALHFVGGYHDDPGYIAAVAARVTESWELRGRTERLLFSFHGMPRATLAAGDPYYCQCQASARLMAQALGLAPESWAMAFQSRFGRSAWLEPDTQATLLAWAGAGVTKVTVVCPGFAVDCLETLEEVAERYRDAFLAAGGQQFEYVPALNDTPRHAAMLGAIVRRELAGWSAHAAGSGDGTAERLARARARGAGA